MSSLSLELQVTKFEQYKRVVTDAVRIGTEANKVINGIGQSPSFGNINKDAKEFARLQTEIAKQERAVELAKIATIKAQLEQIKLEKELAKIQVKSPEVAPPPTISRYWENEAAEVAKSVNKIKTETDKLKNSTYTPGQPTGFKTEPPATRSAAPDAMVRDFLTKNASDAEALEKKFAAADTGKGFQTVAAARLNAGQINDFTKDIVRASERSRQLTNDIASLKNELQNPNRTSSIGFLTNELKGAEKEAESLNRKLSTLPTSATGGKKSIGKQKGLGEGGRALLEVADDFVPAGLNKPFNAVVKELAKIDALSLSSLATFGAIAAAGVLIVGITQKIKENAEAHLKSEIGITAASNERIFQIKSFQNSLSKQDTEIFQKSNLDRFLQTSTLSKLQDKRRELEREKFNSTKEILTDDFGAVKDDKGNYQLNAKKQQDLDARILEIKNREKEFVQQQDQVFATNFDNRQKAEEKNRLTGEKNYKEQIERAKKLKETLIDFQSFRAEIVGKDNPYVKILSDLDTIGARMEKRFGSVTKEAKEIARLAGQLEKTALIRQLAETRFNTNSEVLRLKQDVRQIDNLPQTQRFEFTQTLQNIERHVQHISDSSDISRRYDEAAYNAFKYNPNNPKSFAEYNRRGVNDDISESGLSIRSASEEVAKLQTLSLSMFNQNGGLSGTGVYGQEAVAKRIADLVSPLQSELVKRLGSPFGQGNDSRNLLKQLAGALQTLKQAEERKFTDYLELQKYTGLRRVDAKEQINLLKDSKGLDREFQLRQVVSITDQIGVNNLDKDLLGARRNAENELAKILLQKEKNAEADRKAKAELDGKLERVLDQILKGELKVDIGDAAATPPVEITVKDETSNGIKTLGVSPKPSDMLTNQGLGLVSGAGGLTNY